MAFGFLNSKTEEYESEEKEKETEIGKKGEHERQSKYVNGLDWIGFRCIDNNCCRTQIH